MIAKMGGILGQNGREFWAKMGNFRPKMGWEFFSFSRMGQQCGRVGIGQNGPHFFRCQPKRRVIGSAELGQGAGADRQRFVLYKKRFLCIKKRFFRIKTVCSVQNLASKRKILVRRKNAEQHRKTKKTK